MKTAAVVLTGLGLESCTPSIARGWLTPTPDRIQPSKGPTPQPNDYNLEPQNVVDREIQQQPENTPTVQPTKEPTPQTPYESPRMALLEAKGDHQPAENPPFFGAYESRDLKELVKKGSDDEKYLELVQAEQLLRVYQKENDLEGQTLQWKNEKAYLAEMRTFARKNPHLKVNHRLSAHGDAMVTFIHDTRNNEVLWAVDDKGQIAYPKPSLYDEKTTLAGVSLPQGTTPDLRYNPQDKNWYVFAVNEKKQASAVFLSHEAKLNSIQDHWRPLSAETYPEGYRPKYERNLVFEGTGEFEGIQFPMDLAIEDLPIREFTEKEEFKEMMGKTWLFACYYRYGLQNKETNITFQQYLDLVKQDRGQVRSDYLGKDGKPKSAIVNPKSGFSVVITGKSPLPLELKVGGRPTMYPGYADVRVNQQGKPLTVGFWNKKLFDENLEKSLKRGVNKDVAYAQRTFRGFLFALEYWGTVTSRNLALGGDRSQAEANNINKIVQYILDWERDYYSRKLGLDPKIFKDGHDLDVAIYNAFPELNPNDIPVEIKR